MPLSNVSKPIENIILITVDCLRSDHLEFYGYTKRTMPNLVRLAPSGFVVDRAYTNSPFTLGSFPSIFTSSYPLEGDPFYTLEGRPAPIYEVLRSKGYRTAGFNANLYLSLIRDYGRGFDFYWSLTEAGGEVRGKTRSLRETALRIGRSVYRRMGRSPKLVSIVDSLPLLRDVIYSLTSVGVGYARAEEVTRRAVNWIRKHGREPFFLWIHYMDVHNPYFVGEDLRRVRKLSYFIKEQELVRRSHELYSSRGRMSVNRELNEMIIRIRRIYDERIRRVDANIGKLIKVLEEERLTEGTALILTSDHGQGFLEHGFYSHGAYFYEEVLRVPLIVSLLGESSGYERIKGDKSLIDLSPTILALLGESYPPYRGRGLLDDSDSSIVYSEALHNKKGMPVSSLDESREARITIAIKKDNMKYIVQFRGSLILYEELYDLERDQHEVKDLSREDEYSSILEEFRRNVFLHMRSIGIDPAKVLHRFRLWKLRRKITSR